MKTDRKSYVSIGTSTPIFIPSSYSSEPIRVGVDYFTIRICGAQVAFLGSIWSKARSVLVSTQTNLHHPLLGERALRSLQQMRVVKQHVDEQLGLSVNLVALTPAVMPQITLTIDFHVDKENRIAQLGSIINKESFSAILSLAPGGIAVAKTVSALANDIIQTFIPAEEQEPVLQFTGDFNLVTGGLAPGYYAILGSRDAEHSIPSPLPAFEVKDGRLLANDQPVSGLSYVIIEVRKTSVRSRDLGIGTDWDEKLREAEDFAQSLIDDPLADYDARQSAWTKCRTLIKEAQTFLRAEPNYLRAEAELIVRATYLRCRELVTEPVPERNRVIGHGRNTAVWLPNDQADRELLGIGTDEVLERDVTAYAYDVIKARDILANWGPDDQ
ncbi:hypothetical protein [Azospirillum canadense]|uniref:hypothetical protein n=1 Tax=Azospirillum canadense TaxID=403962 RepID=UPI0022266FC0|nr:hypothetical protein [Azospirillum canadense]MCW2240335.1 hypothetical protein [Azospirillum canadense]